MSYTKKTCEEFVEVLASKAPTPGGGGASALTGAIGVALGNMVGSLTVGKKKYAEVEEEIKAMMEASAKLQADLLELVQKDAECFEPLAAAYGMPKETDEQKAEKERVLEQATKDACEVPFEIMEKCCQGIDLCGEFAEKGSVMATSDAGAGAIFCKAALQAASLNVYINTKSLKDREYAQQANEKSDAMLKEYMAKADAIIDAVFAALK
ncbi:MAG: cyclodeaminase/cyclohydrolase family protein [Firmicutes bacterium]|nr:cyclodeaminase/cyclohydrolase family protein [Bacillota bacterium]